MVILKSSELELEVIRARGRLRADPSLPSACSPSQTARALFANIIQAGEKRRHRGSAKLSQPRGRPESNRKLSSFVPTTPGTVQQLDQVGEYTEGGERGWRDETEWWNKEKGQNLPKRDARVKSAATDERVTVPASAGQRTQSSACRGRKSALKVLMFRKAPLLPEPAMVGHPEKSTNQHYAAADHRAIICPPFHRAWLETASGERRQRDDSEEHGKSRHAPPGDPQCRSAAPSSHPAICPPTSSLVVSAPFSAYNRARDQPL